MIADGSPESLSGLPSRLHQQIDAEDRRRGGKAGWRFLASPLRTLDGSRIAFLGIHPGGDCDEPDHGRIAPLHGSAYVSESWDGRPPGTSPLQLQVRSLFAKLNVDPEDVLAGNLVPFRSKETAVLKDADDAILFGLSMWRSAFDQAQPELIIAMGKRVFEALHSDLSGGETHSFDIGWGNISVDTCRAGTRKLIGLPHLSRFKIINRPESQAGLAAAFGRYWICPDA